MILTPILFCLGAAAPIPDAIAGKPVPKTPWPNTQKRHQQRQAKSPPKKKPALPAAIVKADPRAAEQTLEAQSILGGSNDIKRLGGVANLVSDLSLEDFNYSDIHQILAEVPGVYVRDEEGFGLRPNIGLRGTSSDRSAKVMLLEDGIPLAPAPYSAPAAYYFPLVNRIEAIEVLKGPAAIEHGPQTIGGAIHLRSSSIPQDGLMAEVDVKGGMYGQGAGQLKVGYGQERFGVLGEVVHLRADGFKELPAGAPVGFNKTEILLKGRYQSLQRGRLRHGLHLTLGYSNEESRETYLGLTDSDFENNPYQRYPASTDGLMRYFRTRVQARYQLSVGDHFSLKATLYRHDQERSWRKLNGFVDGPSFVSLFRAPDAGTNAIYTEILRGNLDSGEQENLLLGTNERKFISQGLDLRGLWNTGTKSIKNTLHFGIRGHFDQIVRNHFEVERRMVSGSLVDTGAEIQFPTRNVGQAYALSAFLKDDFRFKRLSVLPGIRLEYAHTRFVDRNAQEEQSNNQVELLPGLGIHYAILGQKLGVLLGVHRGFSPKSPGQAQAIQPETSWNYEAGLQSQIDNFEAELVGYLTHYQNLSAECTLSNGCADQDLGIQYNGGEVLSYGLEASLRHRQKVSKQIILFGQANYTLALNQFLSDFSSNNPIWQRVRMGDRLPYVPAHQIQGHLGIEAGPFQLAFNAKYQSEMRDLPGSGPIPDGENIPGFFLLGAATHVEFKAGVRLYLTVDNLTNAQYIASRRPYGARPGKPISVQAGLRYVFKP